MIAVLGATGFVGATFPEFLKAKGLKCFGISRTDLDYSNEAVLLDWLLRERPRFLINAAGYTGKPNVDACESYKADCLLGNAVLPGKIRAACERAEIPWGHVSSGCIYSGRRLDGQGWREEDPPNFSFRSPPCSFYSGTKALGEELLDGAKDCYVWRLRIPFNHEKSPRNYLNKLLNYDRLLDVENSISHLDEFVQACIACFENEVPYGTYNMTNPGSVTTRQVINWMREEGVASKEFHFFEDEAEFMREAASAPRSNCVLDSSKLTAAGIEMRPVEEAVRDSLCKMRALSNSKELIA